MIESRCGLLCSECDLEKAVIVGVSKQTDTHFTVNVRGEMLSG